MVTTEGLIRSGRAPVRNGKDASPSMTAMDRINHAQRRIAGLKLKDFGRITGASVYAELHQAELTLQSAREFAEQERYIDAEVAAELAERQIATAARQAVERVMNNCTVS